ncbi:hypothetical protein PILCRDRAFT_817364 [Piloderma croceum F 1598]|uniref:Uncharacterized protein n=1 Tax=Piloderma croceum (strain F 1598) TaxID=765440 RepID=A0A0C3BGE2_PILCF|nr:hypothetical protein PILCRDRAFT_817364 [Piloderma croceum F 1598]
MYQQGKIGVKCLGLQCVGFNHGLYDVLLQARSESVGSTMSGPADAQMEQPRKRKRDTRSESTQWSKRARTHESERRQLDLKEDEARFEEKDEVNEEESEEEVSGDEASEDSECAASGSENSEKEYGD